MKKLIRWLAKVFKADITKIVYQEKIIYKPLEEKVSGNIYLDGNLIADGTIEASKDIICFKTKTD